MKKTLTTLVILLTIITCSGQSITYDDFKVLLPSLDSEDWQTAFKGSSKLLKNAMNDTSEFKSITLYINIYSAAGMVSEGKMTYKELKKSIDKYQGQKIIMAAHPIATDKGGSLNSTYFSISDTSNEASTCATNIKGTNILCFEYFYFKDKIDTKKFGDSFVRCGGTLDKIEVNPNKSKIWILRLKVKDAFARAL